jgi:hypothetical protein
VCTKSFQGKQTFYVDYVKMKKNWYQNKHFHDVFLVFFVPLIKIPVSNETLHEHVESEDLHANIFS